MSYATVNIGLTTEQLLAAIAVVDNRTERRKWIRFTNNDANDVAIRPGTAAAVAGVDRVIAANGGSVEYRRDQGVGNDIMQGAFQAISVAVAASDVSVEIG